MYNKIIIVVIVICVVVCVLLYIYYDMFGRDIVVNLKIIFMIRGLYYCDIGLII